MYHTLDYCIAQNFDSGKVWRTDVDLLKLFLVPTKILHFEIFGVA